MASTSADTTSPAHTTSATVITVRALASASYSAAGAMCHYVCVGELMVEERWIQVLAVFLWLMQHK